MFSVKLTQKLFLGGTFSLNENYKNVIFCWGCCILMSYLFFIYCRKKTTLSHSFPQLTVKGASLNLFTGKVSLYRSEIFRTGTPDEDTNTCTGPSDPNISYRPATKP